MWLAASRARGVRAAGGSGGAVGRGGGISGAGGGAWTLGGKWADGHPCRGRVERARPRARGSGAGRGGARRVADGRGGGLVGSSVTVGLVIRSMNGLTSAVPWPTVSVSSRRVLMARALSCSSGRLCSRRLQRRSLGSLTTVSIRSATPSLRYCFRREFL